jgi:2-C-methyl-D-erythritol 4-phosphate cytidylyltransferase
MGGCSAVLLAAGSSRRLGFDKILTPLAGKPVVLYTLEALARSPSITEILLVTRADIMGKMGEVCRQGGIGEGGTPVRILAGGSERQDSVWAGLSAVSSSSGTVLIHDAARPLLTEAIIERSITQAEEKGSAICAHKASDTIKEAGVEGEVERTLDRSRLWQMQTPQTFRKELIVEAYTEVIRRGLAITDDASALEAVGGRVWLMESAEPNLKITRQADWEMLESLLSWGQRLELRARLHHLANALSPLGGYAFLLEKYGSKDGKFAVYFEKFQAGLSESEKRYREMHDWVRKWSGDVL